MPNDQKTSSRVSPIVIVVFAAIAIVALVFILQRQQYINSQNREPTVQDGILMNTYMKQTTYDSATDAGEKLKEMFDYLTAFEQKTSAYISDSEISKINDHSGATEIAVSDEIYTLLQKSKALSLRSQGRFDITVGPLVKLWGINSDTPKVPSAQELNAVKQRVNVKKLILNDQKKTAKLEQPDMALDLGGIAKGFACDLARKKYQELGLNSCLLSLGGNIYSYGKKPDGTDFVIGLRDPLGDANTLFGTITAPDQVISTTGGYERYFEQDGIRYHHILDPKTSAPAETDLLSVTVISKEGILADYLSTSLFIGGKTEVLKNLNQADFDLIVIDQNQKIYLSDRIKTNFCLTENSAYQLANAKD